MGHLKVHILLQDYQMDEIPVSIKWVPFQNLDRLSRIHICCLICIYPALDLVEIIDNLSSNLAYHYQWTEFHLSINHNILFCNFA